MPKQTAVEWLETELKKLPMVDVVKVFKQAKAMEKEQIFKAFEVGYNQNYEQQYDTIEQYYYKTYHSVESNEMIDHIGDANEMVEISEDQAIEIVKDMNKQPMRFHCVPKEISDEEIHKAATNYSSLYYEFRAGAVWYREQLKGGQDGC